MSVTQKNMCCAAVVDTLSWVNVNYLGAECYTREHMCCVAVMYPSGCQSQLFRDKLLYVLLLWLLTTPVSWLYAKRLF